MVGKIVLANDHEQVSSNGPVSRHRAPGRKPGTGQ